MVMIYSFTLILKCFVRAGIDAVAATDAFAAVGVYGRIDVHLAGFCTRIAADAFIFVEMHAVQGDIVKEAVDSSRRGAQDLGSRLRRDRTRAPGN